MKKTKAKTLRLNMDTIRVLTSEELNHVQGGFTYSLSLGDRCQKSNDMSGGGSTCKCEPA